jgi:hypothetical protein
VPEDWGASPDRPEDAERLPALLAAAAALLGLIEDRLPYVTYKRTDEYWPLQFAAGGLARCVALLRAMCSLVAVRPDVLGTLTRPLYEAWLVALYSHYGGKRALDHLAGAHRRALRIINEKRKLGHEKALAQWEVEEEAFIISNVLPLVDDHLLAEERVAGNTDPQPLAQIGYETLYRSESLTEVHAGVGSIRRYIDANDDRDYSEIVLQPKPAHAPTRVILGATGLVGLLAKKVFKKVGIRDEPVEEMLDRIQAVLPPHPREQEIKDQYKLKRQLADERRRLLAVIRARLLRLAGSQAVMRATLRSSRVRGARR